MIIRPKIYVDGPYLAKTAWEVNKNVNRALDCGFELAMWGAIPIIPHVMFQGFAGSFTDEYLLGSSMQVMLCCDAVAMMHGWRKSPEARAEYDRAAMKGMQIFYPWQKDVIHPDQSIRDWIRVKVRMAS
jgi:hypothetical protein